MSLGVLHFFAVKSYNATFFDGYTSKKIICHIDS
jgi:hypothetical protein